MTLQLCIRVLYQYIDFIPSEISHILSFVAIRELLPLLSRIYNLEILGNNS